jgi:hypothetical protein
VRRHYLPIGIDLRLMEGVGDCRHTRLAREAPEAEGISQEWRTKLLECGWTD